MASSTWGNTPYQPNVGSLYPTDYSSMNNWGGPAATMDTGTGALGSLASGSVATPPPTLWDQIGSWMDGSGILGKTLPDGTKMQGWGGLGLGAASGLLNGWMGMQQLGVAKDTLAQNKAQFEQNFAAQQKTTNAALEDRQRARVASNAGAYQSVGDYMKTNGI